MITHENDSREEYLAEAGKAMMAAARTAPKGRGADNLEIAMVTGSKLGRLAEAMYDIGDRPGGGSFARDAANVENSSAVVLIGVKYGIRGLNCGWCGYPTCAEKKDKAAETPCSFDIMDLGIAVGSAVSLAADLRIDNRIMYTAGIVAGRLGFLKETGAILAIPLSCSGKSIYFDRNIPKPVIPK